MKRIQKALILLFTIISSVLIAQEKKTIDKQFEMKTYHLVFLKKGENRSQDSATVNKLQKEHMAHLTKMYEDGKMDICGPMGDDGDLRGICIYNVATAAEAEKLASEDPMVKAGRLKVEVHPFYSAKGASLK
jgi:uncharacterized protein